MAKNSAYIQFQRVHMAKKSVHKVYTLGDIRIYNCVLA